MTNLVPLATLQRILRASSLQRVLVPLESLEAVLTPEELERVREHSRGIEDCTCNLVCVK